MRSGDAGISSPPKKIVVYISAQEGENIRVEEGRARMSDGRSLFLPAERSYLLVNSLLLMIMELSQKRLQIL